jgi:mannosyltransferase OCH1-like enzyme
MEMLKKIIIVMIVVAGIIALVTYGYLLMSHYATVDYNLNLLKNPENLENSQNFREIPKILNQTYHMPDKIPNKVRENIKQYASDYELKIYNDKEGKEFIEKYFIDAVAEKYNELTGAHKADLLRYCLLYINGGIYFDIKTELIKPLSSLVKDRESVTGKPIIYLVNSLHGPKTVYNGFMASPAKQKFFLDLINFIVQKSSLLPAFYYTYFIKNAYKQLKKNLLADNIKQGYNAGKKNDYYVLEEVTSKNAKNCPDGLDRYKLCSWIMEGNEKAVKTRYSDYPWS